MRFRQYKIILYAIIILALILIITLLLFPLPVDHKYDLESEFIGHLIELMLIVIAGGIIIERYNQRRDLEKKRNEIKKELYQNLVRSYFRVKKIRRNLEAGVSAKNKPVKRTMNYSEFKTQMQELIDVQLDYEFYVEHLELLSQNNIFSNNEVACHLKNYAGNIEGYLNKLCDAYQKSDPEENEVSISKKKELNDFIFETKVFKEKFKDHHRCVEILLREILIS